MTRLFLMLRSVLFGALLVPITIIWACVCIVAAPLPYNQRYWVTSRWNKMVIALANILCGVRYTVLGTENLPDAPVILLSKHQSAWETLAYLIIMPRPLVFVFKKELHYIPFFGWGLALLRMIPIDRSDGRNAFSKVVEQGRKRLAGGQWIIMFPEGHRIPVGKRGHYKSGGARLAIETKTPVVPIAIDSGHCWPKKAFILRPGLITVSIGKPISSDGKTPQQLINEVENWIENEMHHISPNDYASDVLSS